MVRAAASLPAHCAGLDVFAYGGEALHPTIKHLLPLAYDLLNRPVSAQILKVGLPPVPRVSLPGVRLGQGWGPALLLIYDIPQL